MIHPPLPTNEDERLSALRRYQILDTPAEEAYDDLVTIASGICGTPMALVSLIDVERQWFKARAGLDAAQTPREVSFCGHVVARGRTMVVPDAMQDPRFHDNPLVTGDPSIRFYAGAPLVDSGGHAIGTLCVIDTVPRDLEPFQQRALESLSRQVMALMELRAAHRELQHHLSEREWYERQLDQHQQQLQARNAELTLESLTDALTGLPNRRAFAARMEQALAHAHAGGAPMALAIIDIDHFKQINDLHGHPAGDDTLVKVARALAAQFTAPSVVARFGGEEFAVVLPGVTAEAAQVQCDHAREAVEWFPDGLPVTVSIGLTAVQSGDTVSALYTRADRGLYEAKRTGRNRVVAA
ncbi:GGDEF domain-containing protein [Agrilutibacter solisilvae]|uniref:Sensor domain-containing diguanylate cyclase n=1 Tax=Agrilutibacter solisilvae TaxID=2763317 RepID=A0A974XW28_9GAMM|nr:sensor domain-containing diguanylate cyclase [Lysobacter solisilvae]QSX76962.1 sensor domain-containing diguanylate cyclase [Lysobacter solisilvae]